MNLNSIFIEMVLAITKLYAVVLVMQFHAFYVSVCEIYHNPKTQSLEISLKIFIDDLETAIQKSTQTDFKIPDESGNQAVQDAIENYLSDRFVLEINSKSSERRMIGYELESDALLCYIEIKNVKRIERIQIHNSILTEIYEEQINLTHLQYKDLLKSVKTTKTSPDGNIDTSSW